MTMTSTTLPENVRQIGDGFYNIRGDLKMAALVDIGVQMSLVRLANGKFLVLDTIPVR